MGKVACKHTFCQDCTETSAGLLCLFDRRLLIILFYSGELLRDRKERE